MQKSEFDIQSEALLFVWFLQLQILVQLSQNRSQHGGLHWKSLKKHQNFNNSLKKFGSKIWKHHRIL